MTVARIEIVKDAADLAEDEAAIRVIDVFDLPDEPEFRIEPIDASGSPQAPMDWPAGSHEARRMRVGEKGVELIVAANLADAIDTASAAGMAISIPSASIREVLALPDEVPVLRAARGGIVVNSDRRRAEIAARARARRAELENLAAIRLAEAARIEDAFDQVDGDEHDEENADQESVDAGLDAAAAIVPPELPVAAAEPSPAAIEAARPPELAPAAVELRNADGLARLDDRRRSRVALVSSRDDTASPVQVTAAVAPIVTPLAPLGTRAPEDGATARDRSWSMPEMTPMRPAPERPPQRLAATELAGQRSPSDPPLPDFYPGAAGKRQAQMPSAIAPPPLPVKPAARATGMLASSTPPALPAHTPKFLTRGNGDQGRPYAVQRAFGLGFLVAALLALASTFAFRGDAPGVAAPAAESPTVVAAPADQQAVTTLSAILAVPDVSPRGTEAGAVGLADALKRADQQLAGSASDREEARFWLRKALSQGLGEQRLVWALTQLGTLYAAPSAGLPDYDSARTLWQLAAAQGDPVALCFLASLHENGLGTPKDQVRALVLYRNAKTNGGCRNVDQSIARLAKGTP